MSVIDDFEQLVRDTVGVEESAIVAFQQRDAKIADLIAQLAAAGEISTAASERLSAAMADLSNENPKLAAAVAAQPPA